MANTYTHRELGMQFSSSLSQSWDPFFTTLCDRAKVFKVSFSPLVSRVQLQELSELGKLGSQSPKSHGIDWNQLGIRMLIRQFIQVAFQYQMRSDCLDNLGRQLRTQCQPSLVPWTTCTCSGHVVTWPGEGEGAEGRAAVRPSEASSDPQDAASAFLRLGIVPFLIS